MKNSIIKAAAYLTGVIVGSEPSLVNIFLGSCILIALNVIEDLL
jgi:hypothetical protein